MIVIGAWLDVEIGKDDLPRLMCRQCLNQHRALVDGSFHLFEYYFELRYCRTSDSCPEKPERAIIRRGGYGEAKPSELRPEPQQPSRPLSRLE